MATRDAAILEVLQDIRDRTRSHVSVSVSDATAIGMALSCSMTNHESLVEFSYDKGVRSDVVKAADKLALTDLEFSVLFGVGDAPRASRADTQLRTFERLTEAEQLRLRLLGALDTTMKESGPQGAWKLSPALRVASIVALCRNGDVEACLGAVLGGFNSADSRTLEDLRSTVEDDGYCSILLSEAIAALAATVA
jgi:hypothetical protein